MDSRMIAFLAPTLGALLVGTSLGLLGSGGSILTVPILVFALGHPEKVAIPESLAIVGATAAVGGISSAVMKQVDWRAVLWFGLPTMGGSYLGAWASQWIPGSAQLLIFAALLIPASYQMLSRTELRPRTCRPGCLIAAGIAVGTLSGVVGVGGGFLAVPALVLLSGLSLRLAMGTSLVVIAFSSAVGFAKHLHLLGLSATSVDWSVIAVFIAVGIVASAAGQWVAVRVPTTGLRRVFGAFLLCVTAYSAIETLRVV
jgi:uncharacterized membrane protein YfcA